MIKEKNNFNSKLKILITTILLLLLFSCFDLDNTFFKNPISNYNNAIFDQNLYGWWELDYKDIYNLKEDMTDDNVNFLKKLTKIIINILPMKDKKSLFLSINQIDKSENYYKGSIDNYKGFIANIENNNYINLKKYEYDNYSGEGSYYDVSNDFTEDGKYKLSEYYNIIKYNIINNDTLYVYVIDNTKLIEEINKKNIKGKFITIEELEEKVNSGNYKEIDGIIDKNVISYNIIIYQSQNKILNLFKKYKNDKNIFKIFKFNRLK